MTQQFKGNASTSFWFLALTGCLLLWCSATNAQKAMKGEPANEAEQIARALDGLKGADGSSIRAVADLGTFYLNSRRYAEAEALYRGAIGRLDFSSKDYLELFSPPFWMSPRRRSGRMTFITESGTERDIKNARTQLLRLKTSDRRAALAMLKD